MTDADDEISGLGEAFAALANLPLHAHYRAAAYLALRSAQQLVAMPRPSVAGHHGREIVPAFRQVKWVCDCGWASRIGIDGEPFAEASWRAHALTAEALATPPSPSPDMDKDMKSHG